MLSKYALHHREIFVLFGLVIVTTPIFWLTDIDWQASAFFYRPYGGPDAWPFQNWWLWGWLYRFAPVLSFGTLIGSLLTVLFSYVLPTLLPFRRPALYIFMVIALGPGLVINLVFKEHWGRPRPVHIGEFGGKYAYIPPLQKGDTDEKSFPCGHCTVGYMFFALYFLSRKRKTLYFILSLSIALMIALARLTAGGHFISDVLWSGYLVFLVAWLLYYGWYDRKVG
ncbi:MAG: phosphatase PAP2 family protein [Methylococcaceae bacterium]|nr:phosphatase PAP2 family protein [Methylococcaceae bacterium]